MAPQKRPTGVALSPEAKELLRGIPKSRAFLHTLAPNSFNHFLYYDYESWTPPKARRDWITQWTLDGEYLDIGCGGYPVTMDIPDGMQRGVGVDISPQTARQYKTHFGDFYLFDVERIDPEEVPSLLGRFRTVVASETLEHFENPLAALKKLKRFLAPGGRILITYPNAYSVAQYIDRLRHGGTWHRFERFHASHIYLVQKPVLERLFDRAGLAVDHFDFRPSDIVEGFPPERSRIWRLIAKRVPSFLGHQFFYVLHPNDAATPAISAVSRAALKKPPRTRLRSGLRRLK